MSARSWLLAALFAVSLFAACYGWALIWAFVLMLTWDSL